MDSTSPFAEPKKYKLGTIEGMDCVFNLPDKTFTPVPAGFKVVEIKGGVQSILNAQGEHAKLFWSRVPVSANTSVQIHPVVREPAKTR